MKIEELLSDGIEHFRRSLKLFFLRKKGNRESNQIERIHVLLGKKAIEHKLPECLKTEPGAQIHEIEKRIDVLRSRSTAKQQELQSQLVEEKRERETTRSGRADIEKNIQEISEKQQLSKRELRTLESKLNKQDGHEKKSETTDLIKSKKEQIDELESQKSALQQQIVSEQRLEQTFLKKLEDIDKQKKRVEREKAKEIKPLQKQKDKLFNSLGKELLEQRLSHSELTPLYSRYDLAKTSLESIQNAVQSENTLRTMLNSRYILLFYVCLGALSALMIVVLFLFFLLFSS